LHGRPSEEFPIDALLQAKPAHPYASRGGLKLSAALDRFAFDPGGRVCLDVGASTGGFTEVLIERGARKVYAVDVGRGQLHARLLARREVIALEGTNIRHLTLARLGEPPDFICIDVSFISLKLVLAKALALAQCPAHMVALIKPQFEVGPGVRKKGIVRGPAMHAAVCVEVAALVQSLGWQIAGLTPSPLRGGDGNREFFIGAKRG
jgi:23S rRNA (cytidine1920-2'-O)/16S rRNA (cytidine1409-2'-O)-methyltransferase